MVSYPSSFSVLSILDAFQYNMQIPRIGKIDFKMYNILHYTKAAVP